MPPATRNPNPRKKAVRVADVLPGEPVDATLGRGSQAPSLSGRRALVTGGDRDLGREAALAFAREGADVALAYPDHTGARRAAETAGRIRDLGRTALVLQGDLAHPEQCRRVVDEAVHGLGGLDLLVNYVAAHWGLETPEEISGGHLDRTFQTNVYSVFWVTRFALRHLKPGSAIINTGSAASLQGAPTPVDQAAVRGAIHVFTQALAESLTGQGIRVSCVAVSEGAAPGAGRPRRQAGDTTPERPRNLAPAFVRQALTDGSAYRRGPRAFER